MIVKPITFYVSSGGVFFRKSQKFKKAMVKEMGFSFLESIVLVNVCENPGTTQEMVAHKLALDVAAVARSLKQMEDRKLIRRTVDPNNQRAKQINALPKGESAKKEMDRITDYWNNLLFSDFSQNELEEISAVLKKIQKKAIDIDVDQLVQALVKAK